jgi:hypothetical protein
MDDCLLWILCCTGRGLCDRPIPRSEECYRVCVCLCVCVCVSFSVIKHNNNPLHLQRTCRKDHTKIYVTIAVNVISWQKKDTSRYTARVAKNMPTRKTLRDKCSEKAIESWFVLLCKRPQVEGITLPTNIASAQHNKLAWWLYTEEDVECWEHCKRNIRISQLNALLLA